MCYQLSLKVHHLNNNKSHTQWTTQVGEVREESGRWDNKKGDVNNPQTIRNNGQDLLLAQLIGLSFPASFKKRRVRGNLWCSSEHPEGRRYVWAAPELYGMLQDADSESLQPVSKLRLEDVPQNSYWDAWYQALCFLQCRSETLAFKSKRTNKS